MARQAQTQSTVSNAPQTRDEFVREYMAQLSANRPPKASILDRLAGYAEDRVVAGVKNSKRTVGRLSAAWEIADSIKEAAYAEEHARHAEQMATRFGLK